MKLGNFSWHYPNMRIGRFNLKAGEKIPLHIHENQFAMAYLLTGKCVVKTYQIEKIASNKYLLELSAEQIMEAHDYSILTPKINAHEIEVTEDAVFLDVFAPGKQEGRLSEYLKVVNTELDEVVIKEDQLVAEIVPFAAVEIPESLLTNLTSFTEVNESE
jgi:hypothetical protein